VGKQPGLPFYGKPYMAKKDNVKEIVRSLAIPAAVFASSYVKRKKKN
jgi:hypothetical protein